MKKKSVQRAGLIPYYVSESDNSIQMLFMRPSDPNYGGNLFQLIKGKVEDGEDPMNAAIREAKEEAGLFEPNMVGAPLYMGKLLGYTHMYVVEIKDPNMFGLPLDSETESTKWMTPTDFENEGREIHKPVVKAAERFVVWFQSKLHD